MIAFLSGTLVEAGPLHAVVDVGGVGYAVHIPVTTAAQLPAIGTQTQLLTHAVYREDSAELYGFAVADDREIFRLLVEKVSGVGPRLALSLLSRMDAGALRAALASGDIKALCSCPGIGKKMAERLILELRDKLAGPVRSGNVGGATILPTAAPSPREDALAALIALGYKAADAEKAIARAAESLGAASSTEQLVRAALS